MTVRRIARPALTALVGVGVVGTLAACSPGVDAADADAPPQQQEGSSDASGEQGGVDGGSASGAVYTDGTYEAEGSYQSPGGRESVGVSITIEDDVVTAVTVTPTATSGNSAQYQRAFAGGIAGEVVGKPIDELDVGVVSGSSLTSGGFEDALEKIKSDAAA